MISFGRPGVRKEQWTVTDAQVQELLDRYHLIARPSSSGRAAMISLTTPEQMLKQVEDDLGQRGTGHILFHGVGQDRIITPTDVFITFLDLLESR